MKKSKVMPEIGNFCDNNNNNDAENAMIFN